MQVSATIIALRRVNNSTSGNPRYEVTFRPDNGPVVVGLTKPDAMYAFDMPRDGQRAAIAWRTTPTGRTTITLCARTMATTARTYYVVNLGDDCFDLRQTRYQARFMTGNPHPHDLMAVGFTAEGMREIIAKWFSDTDTSALPQA